MRKTYEDKVEEPLRQAYAKIAKARFAIEGTNTYPDATFTLRLAFGQVKGYEEHGKQMPALDHDRRRVSSTPPTTATCRRSSCRPAGSSRKTS